MTRQDVVRVRVVRAAQLDSRRFTVGRVLDVTPRYGALLIGLGIAQSVAFGSGRAATAVRVFVEENWQPVPGVMCTSAPIRGSAKEVDHVDL